MPRTIYDDPNAEDVFFNNQPMMNRKDDTSLDSRLNAASDAINDGTFDAQGANSTAFKKASKLKTSRLQY